jgi:hypothetical protein
MRTQTKTRLLRAIKTLDHLLYNCDVIAEQPTPHEQDAIAVLVHFANVAIYESERNPNAQPKRKRIREIKTAALRDCDAAEQTPRHRSSEPDETTAPR